MDQDFPLWDFVQHNQRQIALSMGGTRKRVEKGYAPKGRARKTAFWASSLQCS